ncbi:hypothetical protein VTI28DRAFT_8052 [Corynascus sepedonium]
MKYRDATLAQHVSLQFDATPPPDSPYRDARQRKVKADFGGFASLSGADSCSTTARMRTLRIWGFCSKEEAASEPKKRVRRGSQKTCSQIDNRG